MVHSWGHFHTLNGGTSKCKAIFLEVFELLCLVTACIGGTDPKATDLDISGISGRNHTIDWPSSGSFSFTTTSLTSVMISQDYDLLWTDTGIVCLGLSATCPEVVGPKLQLEFQRDQKNCTLCLFKLEFEGSHVIALCLKCYCADTGRGCKHNYSSKDVLKRQWFELGQPQRRS